MADLTSEIVDLYAAERDPNRVALEAAGDQRKAEGQREAEAAGLDAFRTGGLANDAPGPEAYDYGKLYADGVKMDQATVLDNKYFKPATVSIAGKDLVTGENYYSPYSEGGHADAGVKMISQSRLSISEGPPIEDTDGLANIAYEANDHESGFEGFTRDLPAYYSDDQKKAAWNAASAVRDREFIAGLSEQQVGEAAEGFEFPDTGITDEGELAQSAEWMGALGVMYEYIEGQPFAGDAQELHEWGTWGMSSLNNMTNLGFQVVRAVRAPDDYKKALFTALSYYENTDMAWNQFGRGALHVATDPVTYFSFGGVRLAAMVASAGSRRMLGKVLTGSAAGAAAGSLEGGAFSAADDALRQTPAVLAGAKDSIDMGQVGGAAAVGTAAGTVLGGAVGGALSEPGRAYLREVRKRIGSHNPAPSGSPGAQTGAVGWHGSRHKLPAEEGHPLGRLQVRYIGQGEGFQARGYGIYSAQARGTGQTYMTAGQQDATVMPRFHPQSEADNFTEISSQAPLENIDTATDEQLREYVADYGKELDPDDKFAHADEFYERLSNVPKVPQLLRDQNKIFDADGILVDDKLRWEVQDEFAAIMHDVFNEMEADGRVLNPEPFDVDDFGEQLSYQVGDFHPETREEAVKMLGLQWEVGYNTLDAARQFWERLAMDDKLIAAILKDSEGVRERGRFPPRSNHRAVYQERMTKIYDDLIKEGIVADIPKATPGHLYKVNVSDKSIETMVDWEMGFEDQPKVVQDAMIATGYATRAPAKYTREQLEGMVIDHGTDGSTQASSDPRWRYSVGEDGVHSPTPKAAVDAMVPHMATERVLFKSVPDEAQGSGGGFIRYLERKWDPATTRDNLLEMGVRGVKFLDGMSRGVGPRETRNYVTFDERDLRILERDGVKLTDLESEAITEWMHDPRVSTRQPSGQPNKQFPEIKDGTEEELLVGLDGMMEHPQSFEKNVAQVVEYPNYRPSSRSNTPELQAKRFIDNVKNNLLWLYDQVPEEIRQRSKQWYVGANKIADDMGAKYRVSQETAAAVMAVLSPQKDWFQNVSLAHRVMDVWNNPKRMRNDQEKAQFIAKYKEIFPHTPDATIETAANMSSRDFKDPYEMAKFARVWDQAFNPQGYDIVTPEGGYSGRKIAQTGRDSKVIWNSTDMLAKAFAVLMDPSQANINTQLGYQHKVRNFYNNIIDPTNAKDVTIDTHAVAAGLLRPLSGTDLEVAQNFGSRGSSKSKFTGSNGTYGLYAEAYRQAAAERGVLPREMQSITWEAIRGMYTPGYKSYTLTIADPLDVGPGRRKIKPNVQAVEAIWQRYRDKKISLDTARQQVLAHSGGINAPDWYN